MVLALTILAAGIVLVALVLALRVPRDKIPELAAQLARWLGSADRLSITKPQAAAMMKVAQALLAPYEEVAPDKDLAHQAQLSASDPPKALEQSPQAGPNKV
jgi:branched-subunit amino acid aminotransferase/4-amino-4-deoxychorismate lyase